MTMLAVFRSRAQALDAVSRLGGAGIPAQAVVSSRMRQYVRARLTCLFAVRVL